MEPKEFTVHPSVAAVLQYFDYRHLPEHLASVSRQFADLAVTLVRSIEPVPELTVALRKLLEAKDAAVRASKQSQPATVCAELVDAITAG